MRWAVLGIWLVGALLWKTNGAYAQCDCVGSTSENDYRGSPYRTAYEEFEASEVVFIGQVIGRKRVEVPGNGNYEYAVTYKVTKVWKKDVAETLNLRMGGPCIVGFEQGEEVLVYAIADKKGLRQHYCSRTRLLSKAGEDLKEFGEKGLKPGRVIQVRRFDP